MAREHEWAQPPIKLGADKSCDARQKNWPHHICNREKKHEGDHCRTKQVGTRVIEIWWKEGE